MKLGIDYLFKIKIKFEYDVKFWYMIKNKVIGMESND